MTFPALLAGILIGALLATYFSRRAFARGFAQGYRYGGLTASRELGKCQPVPPSDEVRAEMWERGSL